jgi:hypothetical protein
MEAAARRSPRDPLFVGNPREDWEALWVTHPVVARLLGTAWRQWHDTTAELCGRIAADLPGLCPGVAVAGIELSAGDQHDGGRGVARLRLSDGTSLFLKPRADGLQRLLGAVLARVDAAGTPLGLRLPTITERRGYIWAREVRPEECADDAAVDAYFRRAGALLRVAQALGASDLHHENFVPTADQPVLVDLETMVAPGPLHGAPPEDAVSARLSDTPGTTSMVTSVLSGPPGRTTVDIGALAGPHEALTPYAVPALVQEAGEPRLRSRRVPLLNGSALPQCGGRPVSLRGHEPALIEGYAEAQRRLVGLVGADPVPRLDREPAVRFVARPTQIYARLLTQSTAPSVLVDGVERELVLERLYRATGTAPPGLIACEVDALRDLDVPLFTVPFTRTDLVGNGNRVLPGAFRAAPTTRTRSRLRAAAARSDHVDDLRATLFALDPDEGADLGPGASEEAHDYYDLGCREPVALLLDRAIEVGGGTLAWVGLEHDPNRNRWTYGRMSPGLTGQAGIGLALATFAAHAADAPAGCAAAARAALLGSAERSVRRELGPTDAFGGPAGVLYATAVAARLLNDPVLLETAQSLVVACLRAARRDEPSMVVNGTAGAILALLQLPHDKLVADALTELAGLPRTHPDVDPPDVWSMSLPSRTYGTALAAYRLARARGPEDAVHLRLPTPVGPGDRVAGATVQPPVCPGAPVPAGVSLRVLLDHATLAQSALRAGPHLGWAARLDHLTHRILSRRTGTGTWSGPVSVPEGVYVSPIHGVSALPMLWSGSGPDLPIARALS